MDTVVYNMARQLNLTFFSLYLFEYPWLHCFAKLKYCYLNRSQLLDFSQSIYKYFSFHHFPHFHIQKGKPGDVLIWDPRRNELLTADHLDEHKALCYRPTMLEGKDLRMITTIEKVKDKLTNGLGGSWLITLKN